MKDKTKKAKESSWMHSHRVEARLEARISRLEEQVKALQGGNVKVTWRAESRPDAGTVLVPTVQDANDHDPPPYNLYLKAHYSFIDAMDALADLAIYDAEHNRSRVEEVRIDMGDRLAGHYLDNLQRARQAGGNEP